MADLVTVKIKDLIETQSVATTDYMVVEKTGGTYKCEARYLKGATGVTPNLTIGNTNTLPPGQLATVTRRGSNEAPVFDFGIPQGIQGQIGPQGPKGDTPSIAPLQTQIDNRFNALTSQQQGDSEVIESRGGYPALKARLDALNDDLLKYNEQTIITHSTDSNFSLISGTKNGYLNDIYLEGKTLVVDSNNVEVLPGTLGARVKSVGDDVNNIYVKSYNKNKFIFDNLLLTSGNGVLNKINETYEPLVGEDGHARIKINVTPNTFLNCNVNSNNSTFQWRVRDKDQNMITNMVSAYGNVNNHNFNVGNNKEIYIELFKRSTDTTKTIFSNFYIAEERSFSGYKHNKIDIKNILYKDGDGTYKKPILRNWDFIERKKESEYYYYKISGQRKILSTDDIKLANVSDSNCIRFQLQILEMDGNRNPLICNLFKLKTNYDIGNGEGIFTSISGNTLFIDILKNKLSSADVNGFKQWLDNNDMNIVFKLSNIEILKCIPIDLISYDEQTNYIIECGPIYPKTTLKVNSYLGNVVSILKEKVSYLENMLVDGLKLVVAGNMQELAYKLYPQDFVSNVDDSVSMEVIE